MDSRIEQILSATEADGWQGYLTGKDNFREQVATIQPYKGKRNRGERPFWYAAIYSYLSNDRWADVVHNMEADDALAIDHSHDSTATVLCSRDKDLLQVPGWHHVWNFENSKDSVTEDLAKIFFPHLKKKERYPFFIDELKGLSFFYGQLLTGDSTDGILGLYNVGPKAACVKRILQYGTELEMFLEVKEQYELRFGSYWDMFMCENGRLLWMLRHEDDDWYNRQKDLCQKLN